MIFLSSECESLTFANGRHRQHLEEGGKLENYEQRFLDDIRPHISVFSTIAGMVCEKLQGDNPQVFSTDYSDRIIFMPQIQITYKQIIEKFHREKYKMEIFFFRNRFKERK